MKTGDLVYWRLAVWKQNPATKKRLGKVPCKILTDVGIILSKRTHDTYDVMFSGNNLAIGGCENELEVICDSR